MAPHHRAPASSTANVVNPAWLNDPTNANYVAPELRDPNAVKLLSLWPAPNSFTGDGVAQFVNTNPTVNNTRQEVIRADVDVSTPLEDRRPLHPRLSARRSSPAASSPSIAVPNVSITHTDVPGQVAAVELRGVFGQHAERAEVPVLEQPHSHDRRRPATSTRARSSAITIPELFPENNADRLPSLSGRPASQAITTIQEFNIEYFNHTISDTLTWQRGTHGYKMGVHGRRSNRRTRTPTTRRRARSRSRDGRRPHRLPELPDRQPRRAVRRRPAPTREAQIDVTNHLRFNRYEMFAQDTWRLRQNVTLDYGVRYALYPALTDKNDILSTFDPSALRSGQGADLRQRRPARRWCRAPAIRSTA